MTKWLADQNSQPSHNARHVVTTAVTTAASFAGHPPAQQYSSYVVDISSPVSILSFPKQRRRSFAVAENGARFVATLESPGGRENASQSVIRRFELQDLSNRNGC